MADKTRIERCRRGDKNAYREFYDLYSKAMLNISMRIVNDLAEAEDVLQESFVAVFGNMAAIASDAQFGGYLKKTVVNRSIDVVRKRKTQLLSLGEQHDVEEPAEDEPAEWDIQTVQACFSELPDGFRIVMTLFLFENYSHREIAALLGISEGTSKSQYNRARKKLAVLYHKKMMTHA